MTKRHTRWQEEQQGRAGTERHQTSQTVPHSHSFQELPGQSQQQQLSAEQRPEPSPTALQHQQGMLPVPGQAPSTRKCYSQPSTTTSHQGKGSTASWAKRTPTVPQAGKSTVHPHISAHDQLRTWVYQTQYYVHSSGHTWMSINEQHRAAYQTLPWLHSPRLQVFLVQKISWTWCALSP